MRDPNLLNEVEYKKDKISILKLDNIPEFDIEDYNLLEPKEFKAYITTIEKIVRGSMEYRAMIKYLRENMDMNKCSFYKNVNNVDTFKIKIHIHHHPFTLHDIVYTVYNKRVFYRESLDDEMVAKEVMFLHYSLLVGLIPLAETVHELVHNNYLFIPVDKAMGKFEEFKNMYEDFMTPEMVDLWERNLKATQTYNEDLSNNFILDKKYIYVDMTGEYDIPSLESVLDSMDKRIKDIRNGNSVMLNGFNTENKESYDNNKQELKRPITFIDK